MLGINRYLSGALLAVAIAAPVVVSATPAPQELQVRVYDSNHRDYHNWDDMKIALTDATTRNSTVSTARTIRKTPDDQREVLEMAPQSSGSRLVSGRRKQN